MPDYSFDITLEEKKTLRRLPSTEGPAEMSHPYDGMSGTDEL